MSRNRVVVGVVIAVAAIVGATVWALADSSGHDLTLDGTSWTLTDLDGSPVTGTAPTLAFTGYEVSGTGGCNTFNGGYETEANSIRFGSIGSTMMACEDPALPQETIYFAALDGATSATVDGDTLTITGHAGTLTFAAD